MTKHIKWVVLVFYIALFSTISVLAQDEGSTNIFAGRPTLWVAIIIGFAATAATLFYAYQLKGGLVGTALMLITGGMFLVVLGFFTVVVAWTDAATQASVHDVLFIIGYLLILGGAFRLRVMTAR
jgi:hypothetical protein